MRRATFFLFGLVLLSAASVSVSSNAATITCSGDRAFSVTLSGGSAAVCSSTGNGSDLDQHPPAGASFIDSTGNANAYVGVDGELTITGNQFSFIAPTGYSGFYIGFEVANTGGGPNNNPDYAVFQLPAGFINGTWSITGGPINTLGHAVLYGTCTAAGGCDNAEGPPPAQTPLPGAIFLMGTAIVGAAGARLIRRRRTEAV